MISKIYTVSSTLLIFGRSWEFTSTSNNWSTNMKIRNVEPFKGTRFTWSQTIFIDFDFYLLATPGSNCSRNWGYFERAADIYRENWEKKTPGQYRPSEEDFKAGFKETIRFFKKVIINCLILWRSIATQLSTNSLFAWNQFSFLDEQKNGCIFR